MKNTLHIRSLGLIDYAHCMEKMQAFVKQRTQDTPDEIWLLQHPPVFTQGISGTADHVLETADRDYSIPVVQSSRGGQVTYHGSGQLIAYILINMRQHGLGIRELVSRVEQAVVDTLATWGVDSQNDPDAPGVYINGAKISALGLRVSRGYSYHGLSLNVDMDLSPFQWINPCGYARLPVTQLKDQLADKVVSSASNNEINPQSAKMPTWQAIEDALVKQLSQQLNSQYSF